MTRQLLRLQRHPNAHLQAAWNKYGAENFEFVVIERCRKDLTIQCEQKWIDYYQSFRKELGYNKTSLATGGPAFEITEETRRKMSLGRKGKKLTPEQLRVRTEKQTGLKRSAETKARISAGLKKPETVKRKSENAKAIWAARTDEYKRELAKKVADKNRGKKYSYERIQIIKEMQERRKRLPGYRKVIARIVSKRMNTARKRKELKKIWIEQYIKEWESQGE